MLPRPPAPAATQKKKKKKKGGPAVPNSAYDRSRMDLRGFVVPFVDESGGTGGLGSTGGNTPARNEDSRWAAAVVDTAVSVLQDCSVIVGMCGNFDTVVLTRFSRFIRSLPRCTRRGACSTWGAWSSDADWAPLAI